MADNNYRFDALEAPAEAVSSGRQGLFNQLTAEDWINASPVKRRSVDSLLADEQLTLPSIFLDRNAGPAGEVRSLLSDSKPVVLDEAVKKALVEAIEKYGSRTQADLDQETDNLLKQLTGRKN